MEKGLVWVIGASSGLGLATANAFAKDGWRVIAGARSFAQDDAPQANPRRLTLDAANKESRERFAAAAKESGERVDALVYCAGVLSLGSCEECEAYERIMRVNFLAMTSMVSQVLPTMRAQGNGRIILFSSINGLLGIPFQSAYTASKHAIEGYAECLAMEVRRFGVQVCVVEPGDHRGGSQKYRARDEEVNSPYASDWKAACAVIDRDEGGGLPPEALGRKVVRNANRARMRFRLRVAKPDQRLAVVLHDVLTPGLNFRILRGYYHVGKGRA